MTIERVVLTQVETIVLSDLLRSHCRAITDELCEYDDGWDDARVAKEYGGKVNHNHVKTMRTNLLGKLYIKQPTALSPAETQAALARAVKELAELREIVGKLVLWAGARPKVPFTL